MCVTCDKGGCFASIHDSLSLRRRPQHVSRRVVLHARCHHELEVRLALSEASNNEVELVMLSMFVEVVKHLVLEQGMVIQQKVTSVSGGGSGGTSNQGRVSAHMDGVSACRRSLRIQIQYAVLSYQMPCRGIFELCYALFL